MTEVRKIREGVFLVSWTSKNPSYGGRTAANVTIEEVSLSCQLSFKSAVHDFATIINTLGLKIDPIITTENEKNLQTLKLESVLAIKNGDIQSMKLQNSIWTAQFSEDPSAVSKLEFLLDFSSTPMKTNHAMSHVHHLMNLWETETLTDVTFKFKEKEVKAHMLIIASGSPVLAAMFQNDFKEKQERVVVIEDAQSTVFEKMLRFFYTGNAILDEVDVADLLILADKYGVDSLKEECSRYIAENLTVDNVIPCLIWSHLLEAPYLHQSTLEFISQNSLPIVLKKEWADLMKNHHELGLTAVQKIVFTLNKTIETQKEKQKFVLEPSKLPRTYCEEENWD